ncbi:metal-dependent hydrolase [Haloarchaeobius sp. HRN-SO-5]|uniref:metal-dependent hydrolase n=1 Tax=Haloarchaeobius sp. HRN-SO-5 TaxID=3446118 RepID=UPI003EBDFBF6
MWPWEHLAFGYVLYSLAAHTVWRRAPGGAETVALVLATQFPDLVDKPLSWGLELFPSGYAVGHSLLFAGPLATAVLVVAHRRGRLGVGTAFAVGYASHLAGDVLSPFLSGRPLGFERVLWPFVDFPAYETDRGFVGRFGYYVGRYLHEVAQPENLPFVLGYLALFGAVGVLWLTDGAPGVREAVDALRGFVDER